MGVCDCVVPGGHRPRAHHAAHSHALDEVFQLHEVSPASQTAEL